MQVKHRLMIYIQGVILFLMFSDVSAWTIDESYDAQKIGNKCGKMWTGAGSPANNSVITDVKSSSGKQSCQFWIQKGSHGPNGGGYNYPTPLGKGDEVWLRLRMYMPLGYDYTAPSEGENLKFLRFRTVAGGDRSNHGYNDWYLLKNASGSVPFGFIYEGSPAWSYFGDASNVIQLGSWETYEFYIKFDNVSVIKGGKARVRTWKNGKLLADITDRKTLKRTDTIVIDTLLFTYWNGGSPATQALYIDDVVITTDIPTARDTHGNPYIGMGGFQYQAPPLPPIPY